MKPFYVYILKCSDGSYYTGHTDNIDQRIDEHHRGQGCSYTAKRRPFEVVFVGEVSERAEAISAEIQIKKWSRKKKEALINGDWEGLRKLAKKNFKGKQN